MLRVVWQTMWDRWRSLLAYVVGALGFTWMFLGFYPSIQEEADNFNELISGYPEGFLDAFGVSSVSFDTLENFLNVEYFSIVWPLLVLFILVGFAGSVIAQEVEQGTIELLLAKPLSRLKIFASKYLAGLLVFALFAAISIFGILALAELYSLEYVPSVYVSLFGMGLLFGWATLSVAMMVSSFVSEKGRVSLIVGGSFVVMYALQILSRLVESAEWVQYASFFYYFDTATVLAGEGIPVRSVVFFVAVALITTAIGMFWFRKRDVSVL